MPKKQETIRVTLATKVRSFMYARVQYMRGQVYVLPAEEAKTLLATGQFKIATLPPPDPRAAKRKRATQLIDTLAALPDSALDRLMKLAGLAAAEVADEPPKEEPEPEPEPKAKAKKEEAETTKATRKAKTEGAGKTKSRTRRTAKRPAKAVPATGTLADLQD
jgi:hypothetical protein